MFIFVLAVNIQGKLTDSFHNEHHKWHLIQSDRSLPPFRLMANSWETP